MKNYIIHFYFDEEMDRVRGRLYERKLFGLRRILGKTAEDILSQYQDNFINESRFISDTNLVVAIGTKRAKLSDLLEDKSPF